MSRKGLEVEKNLLDLEFQKNLNHLNIFMAGVLGAIITVWLGYAAEPDFKILFTVIAVSTGVIIWTYFSGNLDEVMDSIKKLKSAQSAGPVAPR